MRTCSRTLKQPCLAPAKFTRVVGTRIRTCRIEIRIPRCGPQASGLLLSLGERLLTIKHLTVKALRPLTFLALLVITTAPTFAQDTPKNITKEDLANNNKLFIELAKKSLKWEEPAEPDGSTTSPLHQSYGESAPSSHPGRNDTGTGNTSYHHVPGIFPDCPGRNQNSSRLTSRWPVRRQPSSGDCVSRPRPETSSSWTASAS